MRISCDSNTFKSANYQVRNTVQYSTVQNSTVQYSTVLYNSVQYSTIQYYRIQYSTTSKERSTSGQVNSPRISVNISASDNLLCVVISKVENRSVETEGA